MHAIKALLLQEPRWTLAVAESLTCGRLQAEIGSITGASGFFRGGVTAYALEAKVRLLGVDGAGAKHVNAVSAEVAGQMAQGACVLLDSDFALATTGYAEPSSEWGVAQPYAWWALARRTRSGVFEVSTTRIACSGLDRRGVQDRVVAAALDGLRERLQLLRDQGAI